MKTIQTAILFSTLAFFSIANAWAQAGDEYQIEKVTYRTLPAPVPVYYPHYNQPTEMIDNTPAQITYLGKGMRFQINLPVLNSGNVITYPVQTTPHYQQTEQISLPYGGTYTKKTEVIPQNPVYVIPTGRIVINQNVSPKQ
ncbi:MULTISPECIES: hypothetical protein [unclassified Acinetobacter]|uniref:hypothetical protein n=1 Tax=unclassified Acinetobacter TaxID=196816 RepID=UPI0035B93525